MVHQRPISGLTLPALPLEVRVHGRGGQGGVTCAKLIAALFGQLGLHVQTFGDYGSERAGAPIQAFTRVDASPIKNANKIYRPDHLLVLDEALLSLPILDGGSLLLINSAQPLPHFAERYPHYRLGVVDATAIAREHGIGSASVVIINTTILGAYAHLLGLPLSALEEAYGHLGLKGDLEAAETAYAQVDIAEPRHPNETAKAKTPATPAPVMGMLEHAKDIPGTLKTGNWSNQAPVYVTQTAPCNHACPAGNDVVGFVQALKSDGVDKAAAILFQTQCLPSVCGRVCPAPCMASCNRSTFDGSVNIRSLERYVGDNAVLTPKPQTGAPARSMAVIGGGPAGLSAAFQLAMQGHEVTLYDAAPVLGGVLASGIPAFRLPPEILKQDIERILSLGIRTRLNAVIGKAELVELAATHDAVIVAAGFGDPVSLGIEGEELAGVEQGLSFLARCKKKPDVLSGTVVVVGGGNTAMDCARTALRCGAEKVQIVYRRAKKDMPTITEEVVEAGHEGILILPHLQPVAIKGVDAVNAIVLAEVEEGEPDASGRRRPIVTDRLATFPASKVILALGQKDDLAFLPENWTLKNGRAYQDGKALSVYFAGDCATGAGTVTHAIGHGRLVAQAVMKNADICLPPMPADIVAPGQIRFDYFGLSEPAHDRTNQPSVLAGDFSETNLGLSDAAEASRCCSCGHCTNCDTCLVVCPEGVIARKGGGYRADLEYCKGCGMCVAECPRAGVEMRERGV